MSWKEMFSEQNGLVSFPSLLGTPVSCFSFSANICVDGFKKSCGFLVDSSILLLCWQVRFPCLEVAMRAETSLYYWINFWLSMEWWEENPGPGLEWWWMVDGKAAEGFTVLRWVSLMVGWMLIDRLNPIILNSRGLAALFCCTRVRIY